MEDIQCVVGMDIDTTEKDQGFASPTQLLIGGMPIKFAGVKSSVGKGTRWIFNTKHNDGNLPSTVLRNYHVVFDYPKQQRTIAEPGILLQIGDLKTTGATMGTVVDALRGKPGEIRVLILERNGRSFKAKAGVERIL